ncbi:MAG TPA: amino acid adenylation domain-containing protein [Tepidisphaeraceae bacterium]|jgi:amino acid adenylation domain-containing protein
MLSAYPEGVPVHYVFAQRAQESPDAPALIGTEGVLTYAQLDQRADQIAGLLRKHGVSSGDFVATALHRSLDMPATFLAILKCGAAYCPLDLNHPAERIQLILQDAKIAAIVTDLEHASGLPQTDVRLLVLDKPGTFDGVESATLDLVHPQDVMCLLYTSGSTGLPKGVLIPHKGVIRLLFESNYIPFGSHLCMLHHAPLVFDASTYEIWGSLLHGGKCVLYPGKGLIFHELRDAIRKYQVNSLLLGPAPFNLIIDEDPDVLTGIEYLVIAGEAMSATHSRKALAKFPDLHLVNGYGPTEATTFATTYTISRDFSRDAKSVPIGKAIARTTLYIYDSNNNLITDDAPGELFIGGVGVAMGYLNRPELTAEKFIADPFSQDPNARLYRTGDLCRWMPDGNLDYIGRIDHQVKIRGHRIEPGEIETVMQKHPGIAQCILVAGGDPSDRFLIGYYTVRKGQTCTPEQLRNHLTATLPAYLVPQWLTPLEKLPINANGKVELPYSLSPA